MPLPVHLRAVVLLLAITVCTVGGDKPTSPVAVKQEPLAVTPGRPLSRPTLVQKPAALKDAVSWTVETKRHRGPLYASAISPDGKRVATGGLDGVVRTWDATTGEFVRALVGHDSYVYGLAWSPDGKTLASAGSYDGTVWLWDSATGMPLRVLKNHKSYVHHVAWSPDGRSVAAAGGTSGFVTLWDVDKPKAVRTIETGNTIAALAWGPDSRKLAIAGVNVSVRVWDLRDGKPRLTCEVPGKSARAVAWSPDGKTVVGSGGGKTFAWEADSGKVLHEWAGNSWAVAFAANGSLAASAGLWVEVRSSGKLDKEPATVVQVGVTSLGFTKDGTLFAGTSTRVAHWTLDGPKQLRAIEVVGTGTVQYTPGRPVVTGIGGSSVSTWNATTGQRVAKLEGHEAGVTAAAWSADGKLLATASHDRTVRLWDENGKTVRTLAGHEGSVTCVAWADGRTLASGSTDKTVRLWQANADTGKVLWKHDATVLSLAWARNGKQLASGADEATVKVGVPGGKAPRAVASEPTRSLAWSPNGKLLAAGATTGGVRVFNAANGKLQQEWPARGSPPEITGLAWSADGVTFAAGRANHATDLLRLGSANPLQTLLGRSAVTGVAWGPGGTTLAVSEAGRSVRAYDMPGGAPRATLLVDGEQLTTVATTGHYKAADEARTELVYVVQTAKSQESYTPKEFAAKFRFKNNPATVRFTGK